MESEDTSIRVHLNTEIQRIREQCLTGFSQINTRVDDELKTMYTKMNLATGKIVDTGVAGTVLYDLTAPDATVSDWRVIVDGVMGGHSSGPLSKTGRPSRSTRGHSTRPSRW